MELLIPLDFILINATYWVILNSVVLNNLLKRFLLFKNLKGQLQLQQLKYKAGLSRNNGCRLRFLTECDIVI